MSYQALLFCPDEKTARVVTQVLSDLEFNVEPCTEPFSAVKKLMAQHYDALVVDCENEQNATLLFKSARNSESNQNSLAVAVVEGQAGVAKAFRIGANLVLTKPINVEQSKGTLRVARGLLRKADASKVGVPAPAPAAEKPAPAPANRAPERIVAESKISAATPAPWPKPDFQTPQPSIQSAISRSASSSSAFEVEADASAKPEPGEAALLESLPELSDKRPGISSPASKQYPWQPVSKPSSEPMASALRRAAEVAGKTQGNVPAASASISSSLRGAAAAAPAKETSQPKLDLAHLGSSAAAEAPELETAPPVPVAEGLPAPKFESEGKPVLTLLEPDSASGGGKKLLVVAAIVLVAAASGYVGWTRMHPAPESSTVQKQSSPAAAPSPAEAPAVPSSASAASAEPSAVSSAEPQSLSDSSAAVPAPSVVVKPSKTSGKGGESLPSAREENASAENAPPASASSPVSIAKVSVNKALTVTKAQAADTAEALPPPPPPAVEVASGSGDSSLAGIVAASSHIPVPSAPGTVKVSQGVIQGLLIRKVSPVYPQQALQMHIQGSVQLQASISKEGKISNVKTLSGDPSLARAAADAVRQWKYKPYLLNGEAVGIQTEVTVNFKLPN